MQHAASAQNGLPDPMSARLRGGHSAISRYASIVRLTCLSLSTDSITVYSSIGTSVRLALVWFMVRGRFRL